MDLEPILHTGTVCILQTQTKVQSGVSGPSYNLLLSNVKYKSNYLVTIVALRVGVLHLTGVLLQREWITGLQSTHWCVGQVSPIISFSRWIYISISVSFPPPPLSLSLSLLQIRYRCAIIDCTTADNHFRQWSPAPTQPLSLFELEVQAIHLPGRDKEDMMLL